MPNPIPPPTGSPWIFDASRDPPVYTRPMVGSEAFLQRHANGLDGVGESCFGINFTSFLSAEDMKGRARQGLDKLRFICPIIACTIEDIACPRWIYTPSADRDAWLNLAFEVKERGTALNSSEFVQSINLKRVPYVDGKGATTFFKVYLLTTSKEGAQDDQRYGLYFHSSHSILDGGPALHALNLMCEWMSDHGMEAEIAPTEEWKNLPVDPITATGGPSTSQDWETTGRNLLQVLVNAWTTPSHSLPPPSRQLNMSEPQFRYTIILSDAETAAIIAQARKMGVSISALLQAAHALAQIKMNPVPPPAETSFPCSTAVVSLQRYLKAPIDPKIHLISALTLMPLRFPIGRFLRQHSEKAKLITTAKALQDHFDSHLADPHLPHLLAVHETILPTAPSQEHGAKLTMNPWVCVLSSLGVVEDKLSTQHGKITVESICSGSRVGTSMAVHTWTMHSKLHFRVQGAAAWGEECMKTLLEETVKIGFLALDDSESTAYDVLHGSNKTHGGCKEE